MKKLFAVFAVLSICSVMFAPPLPIPLKMSYQAVIRNSSNALVTDHVVGIKITILQSSATGTMVYAETQTPTTNANGLINIAIGTGFVVGGNFSTIDWSAGPYFIKTEVDPSGGMAYSITATSELLSVPYALHAKTVQTGDNWGTDVVKTDATITGNGTLSNPLKLAKQSATTGQVLKWNVSTWIPADNKSEGLFLPYKDSTTVADKETVFKLTCIGNTWSSAITGVSKSTNGTGVVGEGAFGVVGYATSAGGTGVRGVNVSTTGSGFGLSGVVNSSEGGGIWGSGGLYGVKADAGSSSGYGIYGTASSATGTTYGIYGRVTSTAGYAGYFKGGKFYVSGRVGIGNDSPSAGLHLKGAGFPESFMYLEANAGQDAGFRLYEGATDKWHIFNNVGAGGLQIYNNAGQTAFFAKQSNSYVGIGTTTPAFTLEVNGSAGKTGGGSWSTSSDIRLKNVTGSYTKGLNEINALQPVSFVYKEENARHLPAGVPQIGFVAQDVQKVFPEAVTKADDGYLDFNIHAINVALVNAVKELKAENEQLKVTSEKYEVRLKEIESLLRDKLLNK